MRMPLVFSLLLLCCIAAAQQQTNQTQYPSVIYLGPTQSHARMTVDDVIRLSKAGISDDVIIAQIQKKEVRFDLSTNDLVKLKSSGVSDRVIQTMVNPASAAAVSAAAQSTTPRSTNPIAPIPVPQALLDPPAATPAKTPAVTMVPPTIQNSGSAAPGVQTGPATPAATQQTLPPAAAPNAMPPNIVSSGQADGKIRVYVSDRPITEVISMIQGGSYGSAHASGYANGYQASYSASAYQASHVSGITNDQRGGADPRTLEVSGDLSQECHIPNLVVTSNPGVADYILDFRRRGGARSTWFAFGGLSGLALSAAVKVDHAGLYKPNGDLVIAAKARTVGGAVRELCPHIAP